ncbi:MAG: hypothetical protein L6Q99_18025 [Planctomycetes bacterium]|nr:hypothetical protein [Planctomycetota bacterium]
MSRARFAALLAGAVALVWWALWSGARHGAGESLALLVLTALVACVACVLGVARVLRRSWSCTRLEVSIYVAAVAFGVGAWLVAPHGRRAWLAELAWRAEPLIAALRAYEARHGEPPPTLDALVPDELERLPGTGFAERPDFWYRVEPRGADGAPSTWTIGVDCSQGFMDWDEYVYASDERYEVDLERIGRWAYVHE